MSISMKRECERLSRESAGASNWLMGCGIALAVMLVIVVFAGFVAFRAVKRGAAEAKKQVVGEFDKNYAKWSEEKKIPDAQAAVFADLREASRRDDASFWTVMLCFGTANSVLEDGKVSEDEAKSMKDVADFVTEKPGAGMMEFGTFFQTHPDVQKAFQSMQQRHAPARPQ